MKPQTLRVLKSLQAAGPRGICRIDWANTGGTPDGGPPILNFAARILEIREHGYTLDKHGRRGRCDVFVLAGEPHVPLPEPAPDGRLFTPPPASAITGEAA